MTLQHEKENRSNHVKMWYWCALLLFLLDLISSLKYLIKVHDTNSIFPSHSKITLSYNSYPFSEADIKNIIGGWAKDEVVHWLVIFNNVLTIYYTRCWSIHPGIMQSEYLWYRTNLDSPRFSCVPINIQHQKFFLYRCEVLVTETNWPTK